MRKMIATTVAAAIVVATGGVQAATTTTTTTFQVSATVLKTCTVSAASLAFGNYTPGSGALTGNTTINVNCTKSTPYTVELNGGSTAGGTVAQRLLANGPGNTLQYNLYTSNTYATIFGDATGGSTQSGTGSGVNVANALSVYGQLPDNATNQGAVPGTYTDTIQVTVTY
jgi:spore coat protein U-like protein